MTKLRYGILGSGFMGRTHAQAIKHIPNAELVAVALGTRASGLANDYSAVLCNSAADLINRKDVDAVIITTPQYAHTTDALLAAASGKHLFIEKPMTTSVSDADDIIDACTKHRVALSVGYQQRFRTVPAAAHRIACSGTIGQIHTIQFSQTFSMFVDPAFGGDWSWWANPESIGHILAGGVHAIDLCRWILNSEVVSVFGHSRTFRDTSEPENTTMGLLTFANGTIMSLWATSACPPPAFPGQTFRALIMGQSGMLDMDAYDKLMLATDGVWQVAAEQPPVNTEKASTAFGFPRMHAYIDQLTAYTNAVLAGTTPPITGHDGRIGVKVALALLESSRTGSTISVG